MLLNKLTHIQANRLVRMEQASCEENLRSQISRAGALPVHEDRPLGTLPKNTYYF